MSSTVLSSGPGQGNLVELDSIARPTPHKPTRVPAGDLVHLAFGRDDLELRRDLYRVGLSYDDGSNRALTGLELRLLHKVVSALLSHGTGLEDQDYQAKLAAAGYDLERRRAAYGPGAERLRVWATRRLLAVWGFCELPGHPPDWIFSLCEIFAGRVIRGDELGYLPPYNKFEDWEITARIQHQIDHEYR